MKIDVYANIIKLLGDKTRLTILMCLLEREFCVCEFVDMFELSQPAISQHLKKLKDMKLVKESRKSQWIYYSLNKDSIYYPLVQDILKHIDLEEAPWKQRHSCHC